MVAPRLKSKRAEWGNGLMPSFLFRHAFLHLANMTVIPRTDEFKEKSSERMRWDIQVYD
jgi:hypothetical protein